MQNRSAYVRTFKNYRLVLTRLQVCLCAIVIKSPGCSLAQSSLSEIDRVKDTFARAQTYRIFHAQASFSRNLRPILIDIFL
jgi:hypothetical protein